jgi:hypothetical protein
VQERDKRFAAKLVNQLALPEQHNVALHLNCFFLNTGQFTPTERVAVTKQRQPFLVK